MSYLKFKKEELVNLEYSLKRELLTTNKTGGYCNTTLVGCNTRKYHGLFAMPIEKFDNKKHILLSSIDETLIQHGKEFNLGIRSYGDAYEPRGHKYLVGLELGKSISAEYRVGGMLLRKSYVFVHSTEQLLIKYTLVEAKSLTTLRVKPFLSFRDIHSLTFENNSANTGFLRAENGAAFKMYEGFPTLYVQGSCKLEYIHTPNWYNNVIYMEEKRRGYANCEDLYVPGYFELQLKVGEPVVFSVSTKEMSPRTLRRKYDTEYAKRSPRDSYMSCLQEAAKQFIIKEPNNAIAVNSGYTWLETSLRDSFISLPGLTLYNNGDVALFQKILDSTIKKYSKQLKVGSRQADAPLWLFWTIQQYAKYTGDGSKLWKKYSTLLKDIIFDYIDGKIMGARLELSGLLWTQMNGVALSWMDSYDDKGEPITPRTGLKVEVNALWYNALCVLLKECSLTAQKKEQLVQIKKSIEDNYYNTFWSTSRNHLGDYVDSDGLNQMTRPNQIFACALEYSPISEEDQALVLKAIKRELLTMRGLRTLSPKSPYYKEVYSGNQLERDIAMHNGCTRVFLLSFYIESMLKLYGAVLVKEMEYLFEAFEEDMTVHGVASVAEIYDGNPPHFPHGAIAHSMSVSELLRAAYIINNYKERSL